MKLVGAVVDGHALLQVVWSSLLAGIGVTCVYAIAIVGTTRAIDASRDGRAGRAVAFGVLGVLALAGVAGAVVLGIIYMAQK
jgi:hypothetical protein